MRSDSSGRLGVVLADGGDALGDAAGGGDEEVAGAAGRVADRDRQQGLGDRLGRVGPRGGRGDLGLLGGVVEDRVQGGVEQAVDEGRRGVVGAGRLPLVAGASTSRMNVRSAPCSVGDELEEGLVDGAEFFGAEVAVVDAPVAARCDLSRTRDSDLTAASRCSLDSSQAVRAAASVSVSS